MNKKKIISLLATFITGLSLAPSSRSMAYDHPEWANKYYETTTKNWDYFAEVGEDLNGNAKGIFENDDNVTVKKLKIMREENRGSDSLYFKNPFASYNNYYYYVAGFKKYIEDKNIQISEEGFLLNDNLNFVDPDGNEVNMDNNPATVYKVNVDLDDFKKSSDERMIKGKLKSLEDIEIVPEVDALTGALAFRKRSIFKVNDGNVFYLAYIDHNRTYILKNSNGEMESVELNDQSVKQENKNAFTFNADYLKYKFDGAGEAIANQVRGKFVQQPPPEIELIQVQPQVPPQVQPQIPPQLQRRINWKKVALYSFLISSMVAAGCGIKKHMESKSGSFEGAETSYEDDEDLGDDFFWNNRAELGIRE